MRKTFVVSIGLVAAIALSTSLAQQATVDLDGFWTVKFESVPSGQELIDELPDNVLLIGDTGAGELGINEFGGLELSARALREVETYDYAAELDPENTCNAPSAAFYMQAPFPMEIYQGNSMIVFKMEYFDMYRIIFMDGRAHPPANAPHSKSGHSVGHWEGNTLVVDTTLLSSATFMNNGFNHSDDLTMTERFRLSDDGATLWLTQVYEDAAVFAGQAARYMAWTRRPGEFVYPYECSPNLGN